ncbi:MAG: ATP-binding protein [Melioribacteraceae bacterium]|nr:ATP-binding protein [Melioribacteraceae bacterium]MCF8355512.1 ATP-binding protein [Melioribacteraceae bacterium]MCF8394200.1 ATP-binding protein [Melioribacteraceae bacterium]MCF8419920.1 ATP-binding protein [Melioribacteraceae bacterium]
MKKSPFVFGNIVTDIAFTNRDWEIKKLYSNLTTGINTIIISPRRWGKSSLVQKVFNEISDHKNKFKTVHIDLFMISSEEEFLQLFAKEVVKASSSKVEDWLNSGREFFKQIIPKISFGIDPNTDFSISFDWNEIIKNKNEILDLPERIAKKKKMKFIVGLDEFQNLSSIKSYKKIENNLRAVWQRQSSVTYCIYGSKRHMMTEIFQKSSNSFYRFGDVMLLGKIKTEKWIEFISSGFYKTNKRIDKSAAELIPTIMKNHPWYVQQLSHYTWNMTTNKATKKEVRKAVEEVLFTNIPFYQQETEQLSKTQLNLLKAIANGESQFTSVNVMRKYELGTPNNVSKNKSILINKDLIQFTDKGFEFIDPVYELWFRKQFFNFCIDDLF